MDPTTEPVALALTALLDLAPRVATAVLVIVLAWVLSRFLGAAAHRVLQRGRFTRTHRSFLERVTRWIALGLGLVAALDVLGLRGFATPLLAGGGATAVVLGFAFREIGENFLAGVLLAFDSPFDEGDLIAVGEHEGEVRSIGPRMTHIRTSDGRDVFVPNAQVVNGAVTNFTVDGLRRPSFRVGIDYADDAARACQVILQAVVDVPGVQGEPAPRALVVEFADNWVTLEVSVWVDTFQQQTGALAIRSACMERTRRALLEHDFTVSADTSSRVVVERAEDLGS